MPEESFADQLKTRTELTKWAAIETAEDGRYRKAGLIAKIVGPAHPEHDPLCVCDSFIKAQVLVDILNNLKLQSEIQRFTQLVDLLTKV